MQEQARTPRLEGEVLALGARVAGDRARLRLRLGDDRLRLALRGVLQFVRGPLGRDERRAQELLELAVADEVRLELLDAIPWVTQCIDCKRRDERR